MNQTADSATSMFAHVGGLPGMIVILGAFLAFFTTQEVRRG